MKITSDHGSTNFVTKKNVKGMQQHNPSFKGMFFLMTDSHSRLPMSMGVLEKIGHIIKNRKETSTLIDAGDCFHDTFSYSTIKDTYLKFKSKNKSTNVILNLGNVELDLILKNKDKNLLKIFEELKSKGVEIISTTVDLLKQNNPFRKVIKPYTVVDDIVDGKKKKVLIVGTSIDASIGIDIEKEKKLLKDTFTSIKKDKVEYDEAILVSHNFCPDTDQLNDFMLNDLNVKNLKLIVGGHPHSLQDYEKNGIRAVYPPAHGKGAVTATLTKDGMKVPKMNMGNNRYDYDSLLENQQEDIVVNVDIDSPLPVSDDYNNIISKSENLTTIVCKAPFTLNFRDNGSTLGDTSELGTFIANTLKDRSDSDFGFLLTMDLREKLPGKNKNISLYNINDTMNVDKPIYKINDVTPDDLREIFETSLRKQEKGATNSDFLEFSNNLRVERLGVKDQDAKKVKQVYINENSDWKPLFDENGETLPEFKDRTFSISCCNYIANASRPGLAYFAKFDNKSVCVDQSGEALMTRGVVMDALQSAAENSLEKPEKSVIMTIEQ